MRSRLSKRGERGQAAVMMSLSLTFLFGVIGFSVDLGHLYYQKQVAQAAADAGAMAAAAYANDEGSSAQTTLTDTACGTSSAITITSGTAPYVACQYATATANGGFLPSEVTITSADGVPTQAPGTPSTYWVQATVSESLASTFLRFFGHSTVNVSAEATAGIVPGPANTPYCMYTLATTTAESFFASGSSSGATLTNCGLAVNSSANSSSSPNNNAYVLDGSAGMTLSGTGGKITVHGGANVNGTYCGTTGVTCSAATVTDPLINLPTPTNYLPPNVTCTTWNSSTGANPIPAGCYTGGISIGSGTFSFSGGMYVLMGGGLTISGANTTVTGSGVTFYNTGNTTNIIAPVTFSGRPNVTLSAPTSGTWKGILMYQDRTTSYASPNQINGNTSPNLSGTLYFPGSPVEFTGTNGTTAAYTAIIAQTITFNGDANFKWDNTGQYTGLASTPTANLLQ